MPQACSICIHPEREAIEKAIVGGVPSRPIASQFSVGYKPVQRHKNNCMPAAIQSVQQKQAEQTAQVAEEAEEKQSHFVWNMLNEMAWLHTEARAVYGLAKAGGDYNASAKLLGEVRQQTKLFSELLKGMEPGQAEKLEAEWIAIREIIFEELEPYPEVRLAIAKRLRALKGGHDHESDGQFFEAPASDRTS
jgi:hypothetical protein